MKKAAKANKRLEGEFLFCHSRFSAVCFELRNSTFEFSQLSTLSSQLAADALLREVRDPSDPTSIHVQE